MDNLTIVHSGNQPCTRTE